MNTIRLTFTLITLLSIDIVCLARGEKRDNFHPGYIIIGQDTVKGFILVEDHFSNSRQCVFKESQSGLTKTYSADDLIGYGVEGKSFFCG